MEILESHLVDIGYAAPNVSNPCLAETVHLARCLQLEEEFPLLSATKVPTAIAIGAIGALFSTSSSTSGTE